MTRPTRDPNPTDLIAGYILDDLSPEEEAHLNQVLAETPSLHQEIAALGEAFSLLPYDMPIVAPSAGLKAKIINAASQSISQPTSESMADTERSTPRSNVVPMVSDRSRSVSIGEPAVIGAPRRRWQQWLPAISTGIAAVAVAALGWNQVQLSRQSEQTIALQQQMAATNAELARLRSELEASRGTIALLTRPGTQIYALTGATSNPQNGQLATAKLVAKPGDRAVTIVAHDLPKLSNKQVYRLWAVAKPAAALMYCGQFRQDDQGTAQWDAPDVACTKKPLQLMITLDDPSDPTTSAGPLVMQTLS
jgi:Anti-sigma-K factor rskA